MSTENDSQIGGADQGPEAEIRTFITRMQAGPYADEELHMILQDFEDWTITDFNTAGRAAMADLRRLAMTRGIYVENPRTAEGGLAKTLVDMIGAPGPRPWPPQSLRQFAKTTVMKTFDEGIQAALSASAIDPAFRLRSIDGPDTPLPAVQDDGGPNHSTAAHGSLPLPAANPVSLQPHPTVLLPPRASPTPSPSTFPAIAGYIPSRANTPLSSLPLDAGTPDMTSDGISELTYDTLGSTAADKDQMRIVREIQKHYPAEMKYTGSTDEMSLVFRTRQFLNFIGKQGLEETYVYHALPIMMAVGEVYNHCDAITAVTSDWRLILRRMSMRFEGEAVIRARRNNWYTLSLADVAKDLPDKPLSEAVRALYGRLSIGQRSLSDSDDIPAVLYARLITAYEQHPRTARHATAAATQTNDPDHLYRLVYDYVRADERAERLAQAVPETMYADRTFQGGARTTRGPPPRRQQRQITTLDRARKAFKCYICGKEGCRWINHTEAEKAAHRREWQGYSSKSMAQYITGMVETEGDWSSDQGSGSSDPEEGSEGYTTFWAQLSSAHGDAVAELNSRKDEWTLTPSAAREDNTNLPFVGLSQYNDDKFMGFIIDTGAAKHSTCGMPQLTALQKLRESVTLDTSTAGSVSVKFGIGTSASRGSATIETPIGSVTFHAMPIDTPFLLCLADMDRLACYFDNTRNVVISPGGETPVLRRFGHAFIGTPETAHVFGQYSYFTTTELKRLHRRFGHPSVDRLHRLLAAAGYNQVSHADLQEIRDFCASCQLHQGPPKRFKFNIKEDDDVVFNGSILVDIAHIDGKPYLHVVDQATGFMAARWLTGMTGQHAWDKLRECWLDTYVGPPDFIVHDQGTNFVSKDFRDNAALMGSKVKPVPTEAHHSVGKVERYHGTIERAYKIIRREAPEVPADSALQMAIKAINDTAGPNGIVPTLLVFGTYPRMSASASPSATVTKRAHAIKVAIEDLEKARAERQISEALRMRNGPEPVKPALNDMALVWRIHGPNGKPEWQGPYRVRAVNDEDVTVDFGNGINGTFRSTSVRVFQDPGPSPESQPNETLEEITVAAPTPPLRRGRGRPRRAASPVYAALAGTKACIYLVSPPPAPSFEYSRRTEILGLLEKGVFVPVPRSTVPIGTRLFNGRFVDEIKHAGTAQAVEKSRFVVQAHSDFGKTAVLTQSPTIQRMSQRLLLSIAACRLGPGIQLLLRDISQAYVQASTELVREFYVNPNQAVREILVLPDDDVLLIVKPLYGVPEAGNHWFATYTKHHTDALGMTQSTYDACLMVRKDELFGLVGLQTDDTLILADDGFAALEETALQAAAFLAKPREALTPETPLKFNGGMLQIRPSGALSLSQKSQVVNISLITDAPQVNKGTRGRVSAPLGTLQQYVAQRARGAYVASVCQPEAAFDLSSAAQHTEPGKEEIKALNTRLQWQIDNPTRGLNFVRLDESTVQVVVFTDAAFANNKDLSSQIGYVLTVRDASGRCNIVHWSSTKCRRVTKSVLAAELYALVHGFDAASCVKATMDQIYDRKVPLVICTDSKSVFDAVTRLGTTSEKRLMIDVAMLRQSYERREIAEIKWISGDSNPADAMTKAKHNDALQRLVDTNSIDLQEEAWVEREGDRPA